MRTRLAGGLLLLSLVACGDRANLPIYTVTRQPFRHQVTAEGILRAETATRLPVPPAVTGSVRLAWLAPEGSAVVAGDLVARFDPAPMTARLVRGRYDLESSTLKAEKSEIESAARIAELENDSTLAELELDFARRFQKVDAELYSRHDIASSAIDETLARSRQEHAAAARGTQTTLAQTELELLGIAQRRAQGEITQAEADLAALEVRAPHAGFLTLTRDWRGEFPEIGQEMWYGQTIGEIPDLSKMEALVYVLEADAGGLAVGKPAQVIIEAFPETTYEARIRSLEAVAAPRIPGSPVQYFGVVLEFVRTDPATMKPGHRVRATLRLETREDALVVPRQAVFPVTSSPAASGPGAGGGNFQVYRREGTRFLPRPVTIGATSLGLVVVESGLAEGDVIALRPPGEPSEPGEAEKTEDAAEESP